MSDEPVIEVPVEEAPAPERPDWLPEKFWTPEGPSVENLAKSYAELEKMRGRSLDDLRSEWETERLAVRPEAADKYELPDIEVLDKEQLAASPIVSAFRKLAFDSGMSQDQFNQGLAEYAQAEIARMDGEFQREMEALGENAKTRTEAVGLWAKSVFGDGAKLEAVQKVCTTAAGIEAMEQIMGALRDSGGNPGAGDSFADPGDTKADIEKLMQSPQYWDAKRRDPAVVKRVETFFAKEYAR